MNIKRNEVFPKTMSSDILRYEETVFNLVQEYLDNNPDVVQINRHCAEKYKIRFDEQNKIKLRN